MIAQRFKKVLPPIFLSVLVFCASGCKWTDSKPPQAHRGLIDLRAWDFKSNGPADLIGEWEFHWQRHLSPVDFRAQHHHRRRPGTSKFPGFGRGTRWTDHTCRGPAMPPTV